MTDQEQNGKLNTDALWDEVGFHRQLGGLWWEIGFSIFHIIIGALTGIVIFPLIYPFAQIKGYYQTATNVFIAIFTTFDLGTVNLMNRFIGANSANPKKLLHYVQYFIWYQMISGLIQVAAISIWALYIPTENLIYLTWIFLFYSLTQYPAMTTIFKDVLTTLQQFDKAAKLNFIGDDIIQGTFEIGFCFLFRYTLAQNPAYGLILGISIGLVWGKYLDDFLSMYIGMRFFSKVMAKYGITVRECFGHDFSWDLVKETWVYGAKTGLPGVISSYFGLIILAWWLNVPQYTVFVALLSVANSLINFIKNIRLELGGAVAEGYMNGKKKLCQYYTAQMFRYNCLVQFLLYSVMIVVSFVFYELFDKFGMDDYVLAIPFIYYSIIRRIFLPYENLAGNIIVSTDHPNFQMIISIASMIVNAIWWFLILVVFDLPQLGIKTITILLAMGDLPLVILWLVVQYRYINKNIYQIKIPIWQCFGSTLTASAIIIGAGYLYYNLIYVPMSLNLHFLIALIPMGIIFIGLVPFVFWMPLTVFLGGWDDDAIETFEKATQISGFTRILIQLMLKGLYWARPKAKLHNKFRVDYTEAFKEAGDLMNLLKEKRIQSVPTKSTLNS